MKFHETGSHGWGLMKGGAMKGGFRERGAMKEQPPPLVSQQVSGMHPNGMHSCY